MVISFFRLLLFYAAMLLPQLATAQLVFQKSYGGPVFEFFWGAEKCNNGGFVIVGNTSSFGPGGAMYLLKVNNTGDTLWTKTYGDMQGGEYGLSVQETTDSGFIVSGSTQGFSTTGGEGYLVKTDSLGNALWSKTYGGTMNDEIMTVRQTANGGYILYGSTSSGIPGNGFDIFLIRTDGNGDTLWAKTYGTTGNDNALQMQLTADSGFIMTGYSNGFGAGQDDAFLIKADAGGNIVWAKSYGGSDGDAGSSVQQTADGGFIMSGKTHSYGSFSNDGDLLLIRTDSNGDTLWSKTFGGPGTEWGHHVIQTGDGGFAVSGDTWSYGAGNNDVYLVKTDGNGNLQWSKTFGNTMFEHSRSIQQTDDNGYLLGGYTSSFGTGSGELYLIKTDSLGNSGCNTWYAGTLTTTPAIQTSAANITTGRPAFTVTSQLTLTGGGCFVTPLCTNVAVAELQQTGSFMLFPNPNMGVFTIEAHSLNQGNIEVQIFNTLGQVIDAFPMNESKRTIDITGYEGGIYSVRLTDGTSVLTQRVIKQ